jgi:hypothetical protein
MKLSKMKPAHDSHPPSRQDALTTSSNEQKTTPDDCK